MLKRYLLGLVLTVAIAESAQAQFTAADIVSSPVAGQNYVVLGGTNNITSQACSVPSGFCLDARGINLNTFARAQDVGAQFTSVSSQLTGMFSQINALTSQLNGFQISQIAMNAKVLDLLAVTTSMRDAIPNAGDRFAVRVNMGGYEGHVGGSIAASMNLDDSLRLSADFGQGHSYSAFSAGLNFSFN
jgi:hypothetical protein